MEKLIQVKTPLELQSYLWRNGALVRIDGEVGGTVELSESLRILRMILPEDGEISQLVRGWIQYKWMHQLQNG